MDDLSGIGKSMNLESGRASLGCVMTGVNSAKASGLKCDDVDCPHLW